MLCKRKNEIFKKMREYIYVIKKSYGTIDGSGFDFERDDINIQLQSCTFKYNAGIGAMFYCSPDTNDGETNCVINNCIFINNCVNPNNVYGNEIGVIYGVHSGNQITNNTYTVRSGNNFTNCGTGFTLTNNNAAGAYEAENGTLSGGAKKNTNNPGYSGTGFVDGYNMVTDANTKFTVNVTSAGNRTVNLRYSSGAMTCTNVDLYVNNTKIKTITCPQTTNWSTWGIESETLSLNNGSNTIEYRSNSNQANNCINLDYITVSPTITYEAENATLSGGAKVNNNNAGYTGTGFVDGYNMVIGASTKFTVSESSAGAKTVILRYSAGAQDCTNLDIYVNGTKIKTITCPHTNSWTIWSDETETLTLNSGSNTIEYRSNSNASKQLCKS